MSQAPNVDFFSFLSEDVRNLLFEFMMQVDKKRALELRGVCKLWHGVIKVNSTDWTALECDLTRSKEYVTTFWTDMPDFVRDIPATIVIRNIGGPQSQSLDLCLLHSKAIKCLVLYISDPSGIDQVVSVFKEDQSEKDSIELVFCRESGCPPMTWPINLLENFPPVHKLSLTGFARGFGWSSSLSNITSLQLDSTMNQQIFNILSLVPNLECLDFNTLQSPSQVKNITLTKLHTLKTVQLSRGLDQLKVTELKHLTIEKAGSSLTNIEGTPFAFIQNHRSIETLALGDSLNGSFDIAEVNTVAPNVKKLHLLRYSPKLDAKKFLLPFLPSLTEIIIHTRTVTLDKETFIALVEGRCLPFCENGVQKLIIQSAEWKDGEDGWWNTEPYKAAKKEIIRLKSEGDPCCSAYPTAEPRCIQIVLQWL